MDNIGFGLWMTAMGMGTVFLMLALLMGVLALMGWLDKRQQSPAKEPQEVLAEIDDSLTGDPMISEGGTTTVAQIGGKSATLTSSQGLTPELVSAITVAVLTHVRVRRAQAAPEMRQVPPGSQLFASRWVSVGRSYQNNPWK